MLKTNLDSKQTIVGFNTGHHGGCAIIHKNEIISIAEERLNRKKYSEGYMYSFLYCLKELGIQINDIDLFVSSSYGKNLPINFMGEFESFGLDKNKFISVDHHLSHAYSSYFLSPFDNALIIVIDGLGNISDTESYYIAEGNNIYKIGGNEPERLSYKGIGRTYETFTNYCGWSAQEAGKTMGLAPYGKDKYPDLELYDINENLGISSRCEGKYYQGSISFCNNNMIDFGKPFSGFENRDAAFFVQDRTEKIIIELVRKLYTQYKIKNLCLAGGVFLNGVINRKILQQTNIKNIFVPPCCDDTGQALGNALYGYYNYFENKQRYELKNAYTGKEYSESDILDILEKKQERFILPYEVKCCDIKYKKADNVAKETAQLLSEGKIIGWFQGGAELGPRALGNRSILCSPFPYEMKEILNDNIKHREMFRPFAPAILEEKLQEYFELTLASPFMLNVADARKEIYDIIPATLNVDKTGRVQTVNETDNGVFYNLINEYYNITGVPVLLNTSFNDNGEPIIETPKDAIVMFCKSKIDYLVLNDYIIWK